MGQHANCNITSVSDGTATVSYTYDKINQLVRANDPYDTTAGDAGTTWIYCYDLGGNILRKKAYSYSTGDLENEQPVQTDTFRYCNSNWRDQLTKYNNHRISYDAIGNPLNDGVWTYTWQHGRQLRQMQKNDGSMTVQFEYNEDGLRTKKTVITTDEAGNEQVSVTEYVLHGKNIVQLKNGDDCLHFFYDAQNRPAVVEYNGDRYAYVHNLQGDVVAIADSTGAIVVRYSYDAWGKPIDVDWGNQITRPLYSLNPLRYRGYIYDEEVGLYYLQSRYYVPQKCRFLNNDVLMQGNLYKYCSCNPLINRDKDGCSPVNCFDLVTREWMLYGGGGIGGGARNYVVRKNGNFLQNLFPHFELPAILILEQSFSSEQILSDTGLTKTIQKETITESSSDKRTTLYLYGTRINKEFNEVGIGVDLLFNYRIRMGFDLSGGFVLTMGFEDRCYTSITTTLKNISMSTGVEKGNLSHEIVNEVNIRPILPAVATALGWTGILGAGYLAPEFPLPVPAYQY